MVMKHLLAVINIFISLHPLHGNTEKLVKACHKSFCYHAQDIGVPMLFTRTAENRMNLQEIQKFCKEKVSPKSWLLEIYNEEEQMFVKEFVDKYSDNKIIHGRAPELIVPLNLNISLLNAWTWLSGRIVDIKHPFLREVLNLTRTEKLHYGYMKCVGHALFFEHSSSELPLYEGICHIQQRHCRDLRGSFTANDHCFYIVKELLTWHGARRACQERKGELASARMPNNRFSIFTHHLLHYIKGSGSGYWVGMIDIQEIWNQQNTSAIFSPWGKDPVTPISNSSPFAFLNMDSLRWSVTLPNIFEMKIVCMTDSDENKQNGFIEDVREKSKLVHSIERCQKVIMSLGIALALTIVVVIISGVIYLRERSKIPTYADILRFRKSKKDEREYLEVLENSFPRDLDSSEHMGGSLSSIN